MTTPYFAYGSNLHPRRLQARTPSARLVGTGWLSGRHLVFHKVGQDGSAKCDVAPVDGGGRVWGALYRLDAEDLARLDRFEGVGAGYDRILVGVETVEGPVEVLTYQAQAEYLDPDLVPFVWYRDLVVAGAAHHGFPGPYVEAVRRVPAIPDPHRDRAARHRSLLSLRRD